MSDPERLRQCEYDVFPPFAGRADAVVIDWGSYMLLQNRSTRPALLQGAHRVLAPGGHLLVSYFDDPTLPTSASSAGWGASSGGSEADLR